MTPQDAKKNEAIRQDVLEYLGARPNVAQRAETIHRKLAKENPDYSENDIRIALKFLCELGYVKTQTDSLGSTTYFEISAQGTLYIERNFGI